MSVRSAREPGRFAAITYAFTPRTPCGPIEPVFPALLRSVIFFAALAMPFVVALVLA